MTAEQFKAGKDMTREEKLNFLSGYNLPVKPENMTETELSGAVNMVHLLKIMRKP